MDKKIIFSLAFLLLLSAGCGAGKQASVDAGQNLYQTPITIVSQKIFAQIVSGPLEVAQGLGGRDNLADNEGMLFDFTAQQNFRPTFWMKGMEFGLDLVWIKDSKIIGITPNVPAPLKDGGSTVKDEDLPLYYPPDEVDMVLEVKAGWVEKYKIKTGDEVRLQQ